MPSPRLSVIIPHLNEPLDLARCLGSLAAQRDTAPAFEIIVVDNGSRELPTEVCHAFPGVRLELELTPGPGPARNRGAAVAEAPLLAFIDADCVAAPGWISAIVECLEARPEVDFVGGDIRILTTKSTRLTAIEAYESVYSYRNKLYVERHGFSATGNMAVRADVFRDVGPFGGISTMEDTDWGKKATALGFRGAYLADARVATPPCRSIGELRQRWDRHIAHDFRKAGVNLYARLWWLTRSAAVAVSPAAEIAHVARTGRLSGASERLAAFTCLMRIRLYRARRMVSLLWQDRSAAMVNSWNRNRS